jgi:hypothetical protein
VSEARFRRAFELALRQHVPLIQYMASMTQSGISDMYMMFDARAYWLELKFVKRWPKSVDANVLEHRFTGSQLAYLRKVDRARGRGLGVVGFENECVVLRAHDIGDDGTVTRREIDRHRHLRMDAWFHVRFLSTITRS